MQDIKPQLLPFFEDRIKVYLREQGVSHGLVAAVFALNEDDLVRLLARVEALSKFLDTDDGANLLTAYRRAANIVSIEETKDNTSYAGETRDALLAETEEKALAGSLQDISSEVETLVQKEEFALAMAALARLRQPVDEFFERVTVNVDDKDLRENRLRLLSRIRATMNQVADFSQIEG
jgi:glycyl-tRNA synthetase beta chain